MLFFIELVFSEQTSITICLIFFFTVDILKEVQARFIFFYFKSKKVSLEICFTIPYHLSVIFYLIEAIILDTFGPMHMTYKIHISQFLPILALRNTQIYVGFLNHYNVVSNIEASINKVFCSSTTLRALDIDPNYSYIQFRKSFDDLGFKCKNSIIKNKYF